MQPTTRTIPVNTNTSDITILQFDGTPLVLGRVQEEDFDGNAHRYVFHPYTNNPYMNKSTKKENIGFSLGVGTSKTTMVNPLPIHQYLVDAGWKIRDQLVARGGVETITTFINPDIEFPDPWEYHNFDYDKFPGGPQGVYAAITVKTNLTLQFMGARITAGVFRKVCLNGLAASIYNFGQLNMKHQAASLETVAQMGTFANFPVNYLPQGAILGGEKELQKVTTLVTNIRTGSEVGNEFIKKDLAPLVSMPKNIFANYLDLLERLPGATEDGYITTLGLLNAYTGAVNATRKVEERIQGNGILYGLASADNVVGATSRLLQMASIFS